MFNFFSLVAASLIFTFSNIHSFPQQPLPSKVLVLKNDSKTELLPLQQLRDGVMSHFQSLSKEFSSLNKELVEMTDTIATSVKEATNEIASRATYNVLDSLEQVWVKFNETIANSLTSVSRPTLVLHYLDSQSMSLPALKHMILAEKQFTQLGYQYQIIYYHEPRQKNAKENIIMLQGLFKNDTLSIVNDSDIQRFLSTHFSHSKGYFGAQNPLLMDFLILYWLSAHNLLSLSSEFAKSKSLAADFPQYIWYIHGQLNWQGEVSRLLSALSDDPFSPTDYLVLPRQTENDTDIDFGQFDRSVMFQDFSRSVHKFLRNALQIGNTTVTNIFANIANISVVEEKSGFLRSPTNTATANLQLLQPVLAQVNTRIQPHPWLVRYSIPFFRYLIDLLSTPDPDSQILDNTTLRWKSLNTQHPLITQIMELSYRNQQSKRGNNSSFFTMPRLLCADASPLLRQKKLLVGNSSNTHVADAITKPVRWNVDKQASKSTVTLPLYSAIFGDDSLKSFGTPSSSESTSILEPTDFFYFSTN